MRFDDGARVVVNHTHAPIGHTNTDIGGWFGVVGSWRPACANLQSCGSADDDDEANTNPRALPAPCQ